MFRTWWLSVFVGVALVGAASCGPASSACNVNTCSHGCCDTAGTCQSAEADTVCGLRGGSCFACEGGAHCSSGACVLVVHDIREVYDCDGGVMDAGTPLIDGGADAGVDAGMVGDAGAGQDSGVAVDSGVDAGGLDAGPDAGWGIDAGPDAGEPDAGEWDAGFDAGTFDAGTFDAGTIDAGSLDAGAFDAGDVDAGTFDAGTFDAGTFDAGASDAGMDAGWDDGGTRMCRVLNTFPMVEGFSAYGRSPDGGLEHAVADKVSASVAPFDTLELDVYWAFTGHQTGVMIPSTRDLAVEPNYSICTTCVVIRENCVALDSCERAFLARAGSVTLEDITRGYSGQFRATLSNVRLEAWALGLDTPLDGGCIILNSATFDIPR